MDTPPPRFTHLNQRPIRSDDLDDNHHGDADHGGQRQSPADSHGPVGILVDLVVRQWLVFNQGENEAALGGGRGSGWISALIGFKSRTRDCGVLQTHHAQ